MTSESHNNHNNFNKRNDGPRTRMGAGEGEAPNRDRHYYSYQPDRGPQHRHRSRRKHGRNDDSGNNNFRNDGEDHKHELGDDSNQQPHQYRRPHSSPTRQQNRQQQQQGNQAPKKRNRPGFNSYLKIVLPEATMHQLYTATRELEEALLAQRQEPQQGDSIIRRIRPRSLASLHLTFFFGGECWGGMTNAQLTQWHEQVATTLRQAGFDNQNAAPATSTATTANHSITEEKTAKSLNVNDATDNNDDNKTPSFDPNLFWLRVERFRLFPPGRKPYLVVAQLEASPAWQELYRELRHLAQTSDCRELAQAAGKDVWIPHVTLANLVVDKNSNNGRNHFYHNKSNNKDDTQQLQALLDQMNAEFETSDGTKESSEVRLYPASIGMGGPIPTAAELDWDFYPISK